MADLNLAPETLNGLRVALASRAEKGNGLCAYALSYLESEDWDRARQAVLQISDQGPKFRVLKSVQDFLAVTETQEEQNVLPSGMDTPDKGTKGATMNPTETNEAPAVEPVKGITPRQIMAHLHKLDSEAAKSMAQWMWDRTNEEGLKVTPVVLRARVLALVKADPDMKQDKAVRLLARWSNAGVEAAKPAMDLCPICGCEKQARFRICRKCHLGGGNKPAVRALAAHGATLTAPPAQDVADQS